MAKMRWSFDQRSRNGGAAWRGTALAGVLALAVGVCSGCAGVATFLSPEATRQVAAAKKLEAEKKFPEALAAYNKAIDANPNSVEAYLGAAGCSVKLNKLDEAESAYKRAINLKKDDPEIYHNLGVVYAMKGDLVEAVESFLKAVRYGSKDPNTHVFLGRVYEKQGKAKKALDEYEKALKIDSNNAEAYNNMGNAYVTLKRYQEAEDAYLKSEQANPNYADVHYNMGIFYDDVLPNKAEALRHYQKYLDLTKQQDVQILKRMQDILRENIR